MKSIVKHLRAGVIFKYSSQSCVYLNISDLNSITNIIIPFFEKYPIHGVKYFDFLDWCKIQKLMIKNLHRTEEGLELINKIRGGMNRSRGSLNNK
jgi:hypothetical protein